MCNQCFGVEIAGPGDDRLDWTVKVAVGGCADSLNITGIQQGDNLIDDLNRFLAPCPFGFRAEQVLLCDHLQNWADILRHAAVDND